MISAVQETMLLSLCRTRVAIACFKSVGGVDEVTWVAVSSIVARPERRLLRDVSRHSVLIVATLVSPVELRSEGRV